MRNVAIVAASFDPITKGHTELIKRASDMFDRVIVNVAQNFDKTHFLHDYQRRQLVQLAVDDIDNVTVFEPGKFRTIDKLIEEFVDNGVMVRGIRNPQDYHYEMAYEKYTSAYGIPTIYLQSSEANINVSSSLVRNHIKAGNKNCREIIAEYLDFGDRTEDGIELLMSFYNNEIEK